MFTKTKLIPNPLVLCCKYLGAWGRSVIGIQGLESESVNFSLDIPESEWSLWDFIAIPSDSLVSITLLAWGLPSQCVLSFISVSMAGLHASCRCHSEDWVQLKGYDFLHNNNQQFACVLRESDLSDVYSVPLAKSKRTLMVISHWVVQRRVI